MQPFAMTYEEILAHLHPLSPRPSQSRLSRIAYDLDPENQRITSIETTIHIMAGSTVVLRFGDVWSNGLPGELLVPQPLGAGILVVDAAYRGWEQRVIVASDDEDYRTLFGAATVEQVE